MERMTNSNKIPKDKILKDKILKDKIPTDKIPKDKIPKRMNLMKTMQIPKQSQCLKI